jgi:hypothetical protein
MLGRFERSEPGGLGVSLGKEAQTKATACVSMKTGLYSNATNVIGRSYLGRQCQELLYGLEGPWRPLAPLQMWPVIWDSAPLLQLEVCWKVFIALTVCLSQFALHGDTKAATRRRRIERWLAMHQSEGND